MTDLEQGRLVFPVCTGLGLVGLSGYVVHFASAVESGDRKLLLRGLSTRDAIVARGLHEAARALGLTGSLLLSAAVVGGVIAWIWLTVRSIRAARARLPAHAAWAPVPSATPLTELESLLAPHVGAWRRQFRLGSLLLFGTSLVGGLALWALGAPESVPLALVGAVFGLLGALVPARDPRRHPVVAQLVRRGHEVVWVYVEHAPAPKPAWLARLLRSEPFSWLRVGTGDGQLRGLPLRRGAELAVSAAVAAALPHAVHGFAQSTRQAFDLDPRTLWRRPTPG